MRSLTEPGELEEALEEERAVLYKHSPRCGICSLAVREVRKFAERRTDVPVYQVDVLAQRDLSDRIAERISVPHQSPQIILLRNGEAVWTASHLSIRAGRLEKALEEA